LLTAVGPLLVLGGLSLAAVGCGGSSAVSKADFIKKADAICATEHTQANALRSPHFNIAHATKRDMPAAARYLDRFAPLFAGAVAQLDKLSRPTQDRAVLDQTLAKANLLVATYDSARAAADRGDPVGFKLALARVGSIGPSARALAAQFGFKVCGRG
jgi:hypothetical protein